MRKIKVLVFPCGSECGLEIGRSLAGLKEVELYGASSVDDHGKFCYENYVGGLPFVTAEDFIEKLNEVLVQNGIEFVYPAMDSVVDILAKHSKDLKAKVVGSCAESTEIALSKKKTYHALDGVVRCPKQYTIDEIADVEFPLFLKPEVGCGSQGVLLARTCEEVVQAKDRNSSLMILENLPGAEYTVDCFTDFNRKLKFVGVRSRRRVAKGISVNTKSVDDHSGVFQRFAEAINSTVEFNGAWFFQVKHAVDGELALLEIAPRIAGSMGLQRCRGVNLPLLSIFNLLEYEVSVQPNAYEVEYDRAFYNKVKLSQKFTTLYLDFDDCLLVDGEFLNADILKLIGQCRNRNCPIVLISRHDGDLGLKLKVLGVRGLLSEVIHLTNGESKANFLDDTGGLLIDDAFSERESAMRVGIPALGPESVEALLD
ncbi:MAG: ATP-grasp domain-containing protein [Opitutaceae bacterium]